MGWPWFLLPLRNINTCNYFGSKWSTTGETLCMCCMISRAIFSSFKLMSGVSQKYLFQHLEQKSVRIIYLIPEFSMMCGIICLATGYTLDVGEREGCIFLYCACFAVLGFVGFVGLILWILKHARMQSREQSLGSNSYLGKYYLATWRDRFDYSRFADKYITNDAVDE